MPKCEYGDEIALMTVQHDVAAVTKVDWQFPISAAVREFHVCFFDGPAYVRVLSENVNSLGDGVGCPLRCCWIFWAQEFA